MRRITSIPTGLPARPFAALSLAVLLTATLAASFAASLPAHAGDPTAAGLWQRLEDGKPTAWFIIVERGGIYEGAIARMFPKPGDTSNARPTCTQCRDDRKDAPLLGIPFIRDMKLKGEKYEGGNVLDPRDGSVYSASMRLSPDGKQLTVRGFLGISLLGKEETWHRLPDSAIDQIDKAALAKYLPGRASAR